MRYPSTRLRRNRSFPWSRSLFQETRLAISDLIWPVFVCEGRNIEDPIASMEGVYRYSIDRLVEKAQAAYELGIQAIALFPVIEVSHKTLEAQEAYNPDNLICRAIRALKKAIPGLGLIADVALDPYTSHGQDGLVDDKGYVTNDRTIEVLCKQALVMVEAGVDVVAPSDMMDGRIAKIREMVENQDFHNVQIMAYAVKYASNFYGPFRNAVQASGVLKGDKKSYQLDYTNIKEAKLEVEMDICEGADSVIIKPGMPCLDVIHNTALNFDIPVVAYQVSGEYAMLQMGAKSGLWDMNKVMHEALSGFKRASASCIFTYYAPKMAEYLAVLDR
jgi:porphobilinogen synthase